MAATQSSDLIDALNKAASNPPKDAAERRNLYKAARRLMLNVETSHETTQRVYYGGLPLVLAGIAIDLGLFKLLSNNPDTQYSLENLAKTVGTHELLLLRVLRGLVSHDLAGETTEGTYHANQKTNLFARDGVAAGVKHNLYHVNPALQHLPEFLAGTHYRNPTDSSNLPFQLGHKTDHTTFEWLSHRPQNLQWTMKYMASQRNNQKSWMSDSKLFPVEDFHQSDPGKVLMVDVGGGAGHQCLALRKAHPELKGQIILQDLPGTVAMADQDALKTSNIEGQGHDFMTPQPIKGAKVYYMRNILHDWPDATCVTILKQLRTVMGDDSVVIIDEIVVQNTESTWKQVNYDLVMMCALGGIERTRNQWQDLLLSANLKLRDVVGYDDETGDSLLIAEPSA